MGKSRNAAYYDGSMILSEQNETKISYSENFAKISLTMTSAFVLNE